MKRITALIAFSSALALAGGASAQHGGGLGGGLGAQVGGGLGGGLGAGGLGAGGIGAGGLGAGGFGGQLGGQVRDTARAGAQAPMTAAPRATQRANPNSVLSGQSVTTGAATGISAQAGGRRVNSQGAANASAIGIQNADPRSAVNATGAAAGQGAIGASADVTDEDAGQRRANRQGPANASATGVANANANAGLASTTAPDLTMLRTGQTVRSAAGTTLGTVSKVERAADGSVKTVLVAGADGSKKVMRLAPSTLSLSGDVVTTTSVSGGLDRR